MALKIEPVESHPKKWAGESFTVFCHVFWSSYAKEPGDITNEPKVTTFLQTDQTAHLRGDLKDGVDGIAGQEKGYSGMPGGG
jgi:hypothetical protein